jgi:transcriptional regulator with XRE-family HTH domain
MSDFVRRLKQLQNGRNTSEFARFLGVKQQTLDNYIKGRKPSVEFIVTLCNKCGKSADWLLGLSETRENVLPASDGVKTKVADLKKAAEKISTKAGELLASIGEMEGKL